MTQKLDADLNIIQQSDIEIQIDPLTKDLDIIQALDDEPNDVGGLTAAELKAKFDEAGNLIKEYINESLIPQVLGADATEAQREANETQRQENEAVRQENEKTRQEHETARVAAEEARNDWEDYDPAKDYVPGNKVYYLGSSYVNKAPCKDVLPTVAANWQMIAKKGADSDEGMSQEEGDLRYLQLAGGIMTGAVTVQDPAAPGNPANLRFLQPESISVTRLPDKTGYHAGEMFDPSGMIVSAKYYGDATERVTGFTVDPCSFRDDTEKLTVLYAENRALKSVELPVYQSVAPPKFSMATLPASGNWRWPVYGGGAWVMTEFDANGSTAAAYSKDGEIWGAAVLPVSQRWHLPVYGGGVWVAFPAGQSNNAAYSTNGGKTWEQMSLPGNQYWQQPVYANGTWIAFPENNGVTTSNRAAYSEDGKTWTLSTLPNSLKWRNPLYGNGVWVSYVTVSVSSSSVLYSENGGKTWKSANLPASQGWWEPVYEGGTWVVIPYVPSSPYSSIAAYSEDGKTWTASTLPFSLYCASPVYGGGVWIVPANSTTAARSEDGGKTWTGVSLGSGVIAGQGNIQYGGDVWGAFSSANNTNKASYSEDGGKTWTVTTLPSSGSWRSPVYGGGVWVVCIASTDNTTAAYSEDGGKTWHAAELPTAQAWGVPVYADGIWIWQANDSSNITSNMAAYSEDGKTWHGVELPETKSWRKPVYGNGMWFAPANGESSAIAYSELKKTFSLLPGEDVPPAPETALENQVNALMGAIERGLSL